MSVQEIFQVARFQTMHKQSNRHNKGQKLSKHKLTLSVEHRLVMTVLQFFLPWRRCKNNKKTKLGFAVGTTVFPLGISRLCVIYLPEKNMSEQCNTKGGKRAKITICGLTRIATILTCPDLWTPAITYQNHQRNLQPVSGVKSLVNTRLDANLFYIQCKRCPSVLFSPPALTAGNPPLDHFTEFKSQ